MVELTPEQQRCLDCYNAYQTGQEPSKDCPTFLEGDVNCANLETIIQDLGKVSQEGVCLTYQLIVEKITVENRDIG